MNPVQRIVESLLEGTEVATTILSQIRMLDRWALARWSGMGKNIVALPNGVQFDVRGANTGGNRWWRLQIILEPSDLYTVKLYKPGKTKYDNMALAKTEDRVEVESLVKTIDRMVG